ncbi:hypothetical protein Clacol_006632 [Clathrus columnatus]|uniref:Uncharacterized protein n=1 Tax=Clathrus columnatus TaxID=1419009 RepID=A0AAV5ADC3_9AGAM|nr:hypothetical protein Clacol_006632 [Clathrus columnatus]
MGVMILRSEAVNKSMLTSLSLVSKMLARTAAITSSVRVTRHTKRGFSSSSCAKSEPLVGVKAALEEAAKGSQGLIKPNLFEGFSLNGRVGVVSGGNRGLGLEMALTLAEAGARVYALDLPESPGEEFQAVQRYVERFHTGATLKYVSGGIDVRDQKRIWDAVAEIGDKEGRVDVGIAAAGVLHDEQRALDYDAKGFETVKQVIGSNEPN